MPHVDVVSNDNHRTSQDYRFWGVKGGGGWGEVAIPDRWCALSDAIGDTDKLKNKTNNGSDACPNSQ